ncbi:MAG: phage tail sheath family protein, partial [Bacteroidetes bacterium]
GPNMLSINNETYALLPDPDTIYYFYNSIKLFYQNGGGDAYIVSVGSYGKPSGKPLQQGSVLVNSNVKLNDLLQGLETLKNEQEPTMYICPEATLLNVANNGTLMEQMLLQNSTMNTAISIFDIIGAKNPDPLLFSQDIQTFRNHTGTVGLNFGVAYYPFIGTTIMQPEDLDYTNLFGGKTEPLKELLSPPAAPNSKVEMVLKKMEDPDNKELVGELHKQLLLTSSEYKLIMDKVLQDANLLPPSGGMAGIITLVDNSEGVWKAPANVSMSSATDLPINLTDAQQSGLNVDAISGKSVNAIRSFPGQGILVWGARTLDGNSMDWKYIPVRRTITFLEQSCKLAARAYVFQPNDQNTWQAVTSMIESFLTSIWKQGGLAGAKASDAFSVHCGLGKTMTAQDILDGYMKINIHVAITHPAEFIIISFSQQMAQS